MVRPSVDLLYSSAFIDMNDGPFVYTMPANAGRYTLVPILDAWSNVFSNIGTRITGANGGRYLLVRSNWRGDVPEGLTLVRAPTRMVWMVARTQLNGKSDLPFVHTVQDKIKLQTLAEWKQEQEGQIKEEQLDFHAKPGFYEAPGPAAVMRDMQAEVFFQRLSELMVDNPPPSQDAAMLARLKSIGVIPGQHVEWGALDLFSIRFARYLADKGIEKAQRNLKDNRGWWSPPPNIGNFGTDYRLRAGVAMVALAANVPADAVYPTATKDDAGESLSGNSTYKLHFAKELMPPARAFWSVTAYGEDAFLIPNSLHKYSVRSSDPLHFNEDGSLDIYISSELPKGVFETNWLPTRYGQKFQLTARLYWPSTAVLDGQWSMPPLVRKDRNER